MSAGLSKVQQAALRELMHSPTRHLETSVSFFDDAGRKWVGRKIESDPDKLRAMNAQNTIANTLQRRVEAAVRWCRDNGLPARIIVLKGRRSGCSLICSNVVNLECRREAKTKALVMADVFKRSDEVHGMVGQFASTDIFPWLAKGVNGERVAPGFGVNITQRQIQYPNGSIVVKETALDPNAGRGGGFRVLWFSEAAHFPTDGVRDAKRLMLATLNTVPKTAGSIVIAESTAAGCAGWFYERWNAAKWPEYDDYWKQWESNQGDGDPEEVWLRVFAAWFEIPRNAMDVTPAEAKEIMGSLTRREKAGVARYGWTAEQIKWRRWTVRNDFGGDENKMDQEYPEDPQSAFLSTGSPAFSRESLDALRAMSARAVWRLGVLEAQGASFEDVVQGKGMRDVAIYFRTTPEEEAWCAILEEPRDGCHYLAVADPASMKDVSDGDNDLDSTSILVLRRGYFEERTDEQRVWHRTRVVARIRKAIMQGHPPANITSYIMALLCRWYGNPPLVVETNKGEWVVLAARNAGLNLYEQRTIDRVTNKATGVLGFCQTVETRHTIVVGLQSAVHGTERDRGGVKTWEPEIEVECPGIVEEMGTFVLSKGRYEAAPGKHDDDVLALAMGLFCIEAAARYRARARRRGG